MRECRAYDQLHSSKHISSQQTLVDDSNYMDRDRIWIGMEMDMVLDMEVLPAAYVLHSTIEE